jgi:hypothetical protein
MLRCALHDRSKILSKLLYSSEKARRRLYVCAMQAQLFVIISVIAVIISRGARMLCS